MTTKVDHNYPAPGDLTIVDLDTGDPIQYALIHIYETAVYPPNPTLHNAWIGATVTDENGEWLDPVYLPDSIDWTVEISKYLTYRTQAVEIST